MIINKRQQSELFFSLILAWMVYALAQRDFLLPALAILLTTSSYALLLMTKKKEKSAKLKMSVRAIINVSVLLGVVWRNFMPPPEDAVVFVPILVSAVQSASICVAVFMWFSYDYKYRSHYLQFLAWLTVATSINIPFNPLVQLLFWLFCVVSVGMIILPIYVPYSKDFREKIQKTKHKSFFTYAYPVFLAIITSAIFLALIIGVKIGDQVFMDLIIDYARLQSHFRFFDSKLLLAGSGISRSDIRPIMEVEQKDFSSCYLVGQVFDSYRDGLWEASFDLPTREIPSISEDYSQSLEITMFEYLKDIIPAPRGVVAIGGKNASYRMDSNGIVLNTDKKIPQATLFLDEASLQKPLKDFAIRPYVQISLFMKEHLQEALFQVVGRAENPLQVAQRIQSFFAKNFQYNLYVNYKADDRGILYMIYRKKSAYCSYFATAMILMLRAEGIPARMTAGFLASEVPSWDKGRYIIRGRDAHAWVEALMPVVDLQTGKPIKNKEGEDLYQWKRFDPTPAGSRQDALDKDKQINRIADWVWCTQKRVRAAILNMEPKTLVRLLFLLIVFLILEEVIKKIIKNIRHKDKQKKEIQIIEENQQKTRCLELYQKFEAYLKTHYGIARQDAETDAELVARLRVQEKSEPSVIDSIQEFLWQYHAARFGEQEINRDSLFINLLMQRRV